MNIDAFRTDKLSQNKYPKNEEKNLPVLLNGNIIIIKINSDDIKIR